MFSAISLGFYRYNIITYYFQHQCFYKKAPKTKFFFIFGVYTVQIYAQVSTPSNWLL